MGERRCPSCNRAFTAEILRCPVDGSTLTEAGTEAGGDPYLGLTIAEDFRLEQLIGTGAMGRVYRAHQLSVARDVAIKILHRELQSSDTLIKRFHQEAKVASRLSHPNVIQVYLTGTLPRSLGSAHGDARIGGEAYLVMEHLDGVSLEAALAAAGGALPLSRALHVLLQVSDAVGEAHAHHIVHRDLKPENVMLVRRGGDPDFAKVLDFGVARADLGEDSIATHTGAVFGSARYVSPEGARGERVGPAADVYSLATLLFRCLAGQTPFDGDNPVAVLIQHSSRPAPDITSFERCRALPAPIAELITKNLAKQPEAREQSGRAFAEALARAIQASARAEGPVSVATARVLTTLIDPEPVDSPRSSPHGSSSRTQLIEPGIPGRHSGTELLDPPESARERGSLSPSRPSWARPSVTEPGAGEGLHGAHETPLSERAPQRGQEPPRLDQSALGERASDPYAHLTPEPPASTGDPRVSAPPASGPPSSSAHWSASGPPSAAPPSAGPVSSAELPSSALSAPPLTPGMTPGRRALVWLACFALGAGLALAAAFGFGVFERRTLTPESYVAQASAALEAGRLSEPPDDNVRDLTDAALRHWPRHPGLLDVRRRAAAQALAEARASLAEPAEARRRGRLAVELDPDLEAARELVRQLDRQLEPPEAPSIEAPSAEPPPRRPPPKPAATPPPSAAPAAPSAAPEPAPAPAPSGGRWL
ncbi:MAG: protein kinase [Polyangiaceae bacterium]|nr:protein kinase [Polyangiaceae bacterium]